MTTSVYSNPQYNLDSATGVLHELTGTVATQSVAAYRDASNVAKTLTVGATSNVDVEAVENVRLYMGEDAAVQVVNTTFSNGLRVDSNILNIGLSDGATGVYTYDQPLVLSGRDTSNTTVVSAATFRDSNDYQELSTTRVKGFVVDATVGITSNLSVGKDMVVGENSTVAGNTFTSTINLFKNRDPSASNKFLNQTAYGFYINDYDQLELVKYDKFNSNSVTTSHIKRVATFGNSPSNTLVGDPENYTVLNQFNGINNGSNGTTAGISPMTWKAAVDKTRVYYNASNVGINTDAPEFWLDVRGDVFSSADVYAMSNVGVGTSNPTAKLDVRGDTVIDGDLRFTGALIGAFPGSGSWTGAGAQLYVLGSNVGVGTSSPSAVLDVLGTQRVTTDSVGGVLLGNTASNVDGASVVQIAGDANAARPPLATYMGLASTQTQIRFDNPHGSVGEIMTEDSNLVIAGHAGLASVHFSSNGFIGVGTSAPSAELTVAGGIYATGDIVASSDIRKKFALESLVDPLGIVQQLRGFKYKYVNRPKQNGHKYLGLIAQDVEKVLPEVIYEDAQGFKSVAYGNMMALMVECIKELKSQIDAVSKTQPNTQ